MLHRQDDEGLLLVSQPAHGWISGQLARAWGNSDFDALPEEVCLAAEQHDTGFLDWEQRPTLNPETGLPHTFLELPTHVHLSIWTTGIGRLLRLGRLPALLVSMHFTAIAKRFQHEKPEPEATLVARFLDQQEVLQTSLTTSLKNDFYYGDRSSDDQIQAAQEMLSLLDLFSLQILLRFREEKLNELPAGPKATRFSLQPQNSSCTEVSVAPWPFSTPDVTAVCDARKFLKRYTDVSSMRRALRAAAPVTLRIRLSPG